MIVAARTRVPWATAVVRACALVALAACASPALRRESGSTTDGPDVSALIVATERARHRALVDADVTAMDSLHATDFEVVNPLGRLSSRRQYLESVASGSTDYLAWPADSMRVRAYSRSAVIRYWSRVVLTIRGTSQPVVPAWNVAVYERRAGRWQIVWFQVTYVR